MSEQLINSLDLIKELRRRKQETAWKRFEPYEPQKDFLFSTARITALFGGNQCISGDTLILDKSDGEYKRVDSILDNFKVESWDGFNIVDADAERPFVKCIDEMFLYEFDNGFSVKATQYHLILTEFGWLPIGIAALRGCAVCLPRSTEGISLTTLQQGVDHCCDTTVGSLSDCPEHLHLCDELLRLVSEYDLDVRTSQVDAQEHISVSSPVPSSEPSDVLPYRQECIRVCQPSSPPPILDGLVQIEVPSVESEYRTSCRTWIPTSDLLQVRLQFSDGSIRQPRSTCGSDLQANHKYLARLAVASSPCLITSYSKIVASRLIGKMEVYDFVVPQYGNYILGGICHHNTGKSNTASFKVFCHATGLYPDWWDGPRFNRPTNGWCVGVTNESTRDNPQRKLIGARLDEPGGGWLPLNTIVDFSKRRNIEDAVDTIWVRHVSGGISTIGFKANEMGREKLQGPTLDWVWGDEELDKGVFDELVQRTSAIDDSQIMITFTPLKGVTPMVLFLLDTDDETIVKKIYLSVYQAKHISPERIKQMEEMYRNEPHLLKARMEGIPTVGEGLIYPFDPKDLFIRPFETEKWWPRLGAVDFGWTHPTAIGGAVMDPDTSAIYVDRLHYKSNMRVPDHCSVMRSWGDIDYACDPAGLQADKASGIKLMHAYLNDLQPGWENIPDERRRMFPADNAVFAGISEVYGMMKEGKLFFFDKPEMEPFRRELMLYRYDPKTGKPIKTNDDALDMLRYLVMSKSRFRRMGENPYNKSVSFEQWRPARPGY